MMDAGLQPARNVIERQLRTKFGRLSADVLDCVATATRARLEAWGGRLLSAERVDDVFVSEPRRAKRSRRSPRRSR